MTETPTNQLVCPKCHGTMRSYERNNITIDQCQECRGIFLDRGELERLIDAEEQRYGTLPPPSPTPPGADARYESGGDPGYQQGHHGDSKHGAKYGGKRRRGGFLGELFD